jgi:hypothetical protein
VQSLSPHELNLRRATQPLGLVAVLLFGVRRFDLSNDITGALAPLTGNPDENMVPLALLAALLLYGLASLITGMRRSWGVRSDGMLPARAFIKFAAGVIGLVTFNSEASMTAGEFWPALLWLSFGAASIWCVVTGGVRFVLLTTGGGSALAIVNKQLKQRNAPLRGARRRPWWKFW